MGRPGWPADLYLIDMVVAGIGVDFPIIVLGFSCDLQHHIHLSPIHIQPLVIFFQNFEETICECSRANL